MTAVSLGRDREPMSSLIRISKACANLHLLVGLGHVVAHALLGVIPSGSQSAEIASINLVLPVISLAILKRNPLMGARWLSFSLLACFAYGAYYHFLFESPDHVGHLPHGAWRLPFQISAVLLAVVDGAGAVALAIRCFTGPSCERQRSALQPRRPRTCVRDDALDAQLERELHKLDD
jgi:hypothetical protein